jgi:hypothetical protein
MRKLYWALLHFYPAEYQAAFAREMQATFEQAYADKAGWRTLAFFAVSEIVGLLRSASAEWLAKRTCREAYITYRCSSGEADEPRSEIADLQNRLQQALRAMEFAIAHHDFPKARFYFGRRTNHPRAIAARLVSG